MQEAEEQGNKTARVAAVLTILIAVGLVAWLLMRTAPYAVTVQFQSVNQLVIGNLVQTAGRPVGKVTEIELSDDGVAEVELSIDDDFAPLREGTQAQLRTASLSGVANRYVELRLPEGGSDEIPDGGRIGLADTTTNVDLDQFFNIFDGKTRTGLRNFIRGNAELYEGRGREANLGWKYLNPSLVATRRLFAEVNRDTPTLERFVVASSRLVADLADRDDDLAALIDRLATATGAIGAERQSLTRAVAALPPFMRQSNTSFANLRATLDSLDPLIAATKPVAPVLDDVLTELGPLTREAKPTIRSLADVAQRPGRDNDLVELGKSVLPFRDIAIGPVKANGADRPGSFLVGAESLRGQLPSLSFLRPYSVDLTGWFDDFSHSGLYDAFQSASRNALTVNAFSTVAGVLAPVPPQLRGALLSQVASLRQNNRCPGTAERDPGDKSIPYRPSPLDSDEGGCDPTQVPPGN